VRTERARPRPLAAIRARTTPDRLGSDIIRLLDVIWPVLRAQGAGTGHNVVIYHGTTDGLLTQRQRAAESSIRALSAVPHLRRRPREPLAA